MLPRKPLANWQNSAHDGNRRAMSFASACGLGEAGPRAADRRLAAPVCKDICLDCYPSLPLWPGPLRVGSPLRATRRVSENFCRAGIFRFSATPIGLESTTITTLERGSLSCTILLHFWFRCLSALPPAPANRSIRTVRHWVPSVVRRWVPRPTTTLPKARLRAAYWVHSQATKGIAAKAKLRLSADLAAHFRTIRGKTRMVFFLVRPAEGAGAVWGGRCSRRS